MIRTAFLAVALISAGAAHASDWPGLPGMHEGALHHAPIGHRRLCAEQPQLCIETGGRYEVARVIDRLARAGSVSRRRPMVTVDALAQLAAVNDAVNALVAPRPDVDERWALSVIDGDCEEYVLLKRETLAALGWPRAALRIAVVETRDGVSHAVLVVATEFEDLVLDNLRNDIVGVGASTHRFVTAQSLYRPGRWVAIDEVS